MKTLFSNRHADAFAKTILFCGLTHLAILVYQALRGDPYGLNVFRIVGLDLLVPELGRGATSFAWSCVVSTVLYAFIYLRLTRPAAKDNSDKKP